MKYLKNGPHQKKKKKTPWPKQASAMGVMASPGVLSDSLGPAKGPSFQSLEYKG